MTVGRIGRSVPAVLPGGPPSDAALLSRVRAGDERALATLYDVHAGLVYGLARRVTCDPHLAQDITQEVFAYVWELPDRIDLAKGTIRSYLAVLAHRRAVDEVRRRERGHRAAAALVTPEAEEGPEEEVLETAAQAWRKQRLDKVLAELPDDQRAALTLAYYGGQTYSQVARTLGIPEGTAKSRLRLALKRLRTLLGDELRTAT